MNNNIDIPEFLIKNDIIMLDTSFIMDNDFEVFVESIELSLMTIKKKMFVSKAVWAELLRHINGNDKTKQKKAINSITVLSLHRNIFNIDETNVSTEQILRAFADAEFLSHLTLNKAAYSQALLTNDNKLSKDALNINKFQSCNGKKVSVYHLTQGTLSLYECNEKIDSKTATSAKDLLNVEELRSPSSDKNSDTLLTFCRYAGVSIFSASLGFVISKYGKNLVNTFKSIA